MRKSNLFNKGINVLTAVALLLMFNGLAVTAGEHPEHPEQSKQSEHPEHPEQAVKQTASIESMAKAIEDYVTSDSELKGGYFLIYDQKAQLPLLLNMTKVHKERLAKVGDNLYFACCDFKEKSGKMFDLDFFMEAENGELFVTEVMIHKEEGKARYSWFEENGIWKRK